MSNVPGPVSFRYRQSAEGSHNIPEGDPGTYTKGSSILKFKDLKNSSTYSLWKLQYFPCHNKLQLLVQLPKNWVFPPKNRGILPPKWMVYFMKNPIKMHDLGVFPYFWKHPICQLFSLKKGGLCGSAFVGLGTFGRQQILTEGGFCWGWETTSNWSCTKKNITTSGITVITDIYIYIYLGKL